MLRTSFLTKIGTGFLLTLALLFSYPSQADHLNPSPSRKEIRQEARFLKLKGKRLQQEGKELLRESRDIKSEPGSKKEVRKLRREGRFLLKKGKILEKQARLLRKGKISYHAAVRF